MTQCCYCQRPVTTRRSDGIFISLLKLLALYITLVFVGGTLINTGHPVASEVGRLIHVVTLIDPAINWATAQGWEYLASGLRMAAHGLPMGWMT